MRNRINDYQQITTLQLQPVRASYVAQGTLIGVSSPSPGDVSFVSDPLSLTLTLTRELTEDGAEDRLAPCLEGNDTLLRRKDRKANRDTPHERESCLSSEGGTGCRAPRGSRSSSAQSTGGTADSTTGYDARCPSSDQHPSRLRKGVVTGLC